MGVFLEIIQSISNGLSQLFCCCATGNTGDQDEEKVQSSNIKPNITDNNQDTILPKAYRIAPLIAPVVELSIESDIKPKNVDSKIENRCVEETQTKTIITIKDDLSPNKVDVAQDGLLHKKTEVKKPVHPPPIEKTRNFSKLSQTSLSKANAIKRDNLFLKNMSDSLNLPMLQSINDCVKYEILNKRSHKYIKLKKKFPEYLTILEIREVKNPYLRIAFELRRKEFYRNIPPRTMFHGTSAQYLTSICTFNFNWRFSGKTKGHRHGKGVNFTQFPGFAASFCDKATTKIMIVADVLIDTSCEGHGEMVVPPEGYDTTTEKSGKPKIFVKYNDNEFCPKQVVYFVKNK